MLALFSVVAKLTLHMFYSRNNKPEDSDFVPVNATSAGRTFLALRDDGTVVQVKLVGNYKECRIKI